jgi:hypothetical protein
MAEVRLKDAQRLLAFNDLFIGANSHISARAAPDGYRRFLTKRLVSCLF